MKRLVAVFTVLFLAFTATGVLLAQSNPFVGTWKLDVAKSKFSGPAPQSQMRTWDAAGNVKVDSVGANGKSMSYGYLVKTDGKDHPTSGTMPNGAGVVSSKKINANIIEANFTRDGKHAESTKFTLSKDGKTLKISAQGTTPDGTAFNNETVWDKQ